MSGTPGSTLEGVGLTFTYYVGSTATGTPLRAPDSNGTYTVVAAFAGSSDYSSGSIQYDIHNRPGDAQGRGDGRGGHLHQQPVCSDCHDRGSQRHAGQHAGRGGPDVHVLRRQHGDRHAAVGAPSGGTYTVVESFAGSLDYGSTSKSTTFTIGQAAQGHGDDASGTYNGNPFPATDTVAGVSGTAGRRWKASR